MKKDCQNCKNHVPVVDKYSPCFGCTVAGDGSPSNWEPNGTDIYAPTNADRIRAMSDEELAECISKRAVDRLCEIVCGCECKAFATLDKTSDQVCKEIVLKWLKRPAKEDA